MNKNFKNKDFKSQIFPSVACEEDIRLINKFTRNELKAEDVYIFSVLLCDNEVDRDLERFDTESLRKLAEMFVGVTGIVDHTMKSSDQTSRLFRVDFIEDLTKTTTVGESYAYVKGFAYMLRTNKNSDMIAEIDAGIKKEVSVSCSVSEIVCSACGMNQKSGRCEHRKGEELDGKICHRILKGVTDAYEWSFVAVPAQRAAGVTKSFGMNKEEKKLENILKALNGGESEITLKKVEIDTLKDYIVTLEKQAEDGKKYRKNIECEAIRLGSIAMPQLESKSLETMCKRLSTDEVSELKKAFETSVQKKIPFFSQLMTEDKPMQNNNQFKI